jgi:glucoside 3-dehydrogenase (cytochrome c) hitch-hiker subunit
MAKPEIPRGIRLSRRALLKAIGGSAGAAVSFPILNRAAPGLTLAEVSNSEAHFFSVQQMETLDGLSETIIPTDEHSPGAKAARVSMYIDFIVADSDERRKKFWMEGLAAMDRMARTEYGKTFAQCDPEQQFNLLLKLSENEDHPQTAEEHFFVEMKQATIRGYYTSAIGIHQDLEYQGNTALEDFPSCAMPKPSDDKS